MNFLVASLKNQANVIWKVMAQSTQFHALPDLSGARNYSPNYKLDEDEWFRLSQFRTRGFSNPLIGTRFTSTNFNQLKTKDYPSISYLCFKQNHFFLFQKLNPSQLISKKWFEISNAPSLESNKSIVVLSIFLDAVYDESSDLLYFKDLVRIKKIFPGIEELYRVATHAEVESFVSNDFIQLSTTYGIDRIKVANRKRIASVVDRLSGLSKKEIKSLVAYTKSYCGVQYSKGKFQISSEDELKRVLYGIEERYYTTKMSKERRLANSVMSLDEK